MSQVAAVKDATDPATSAVPCAREHERDWSRIWWWSRLLLLVLFGIIFLSRLVGNHFADGLRRYDEINAEADVWLGEPICTDALKRLRGGGVPHCDRYQRHRDTNRWAWAYRYTLDNVSVWTTLGLDGFFHTDTMTMLLQRVMVWVIIGAVILLLVCYALCLHFVGRGHASAAAPATVSANAALPHFPLLCDASALAGDAGPNVFAHSHRSSLRIRQQRHAHHHGGDDDDGVCSEGLVLHCAHKKGKETPSKSTPSDDDDDADTPTSRLVK
jgi:hypothetical protein